MSNALVNQKGCPKCGGTGHVPADSREHFRVESEAWAKSFDRKLVALSDFDLDKHKSILRPGLAVADLRPGGWWQVKVYLAVTAVPEDAVAIGEGSFCQRWSQALEVNGLRLWSFDIINEKALWFEHVGASRRSELRRVKSDPVGLRKALLPGEVTLP